MGNKNNRGGAPVIRAAQKYAEMQLAAKELAEKREKAQKEMAEEAKAQQLAQQKTLARQRAFDFDYSTLPQHSALAVKKNSEDGTVKLFINIDIVHPHKTARDINLLAVLPRYAQLITKVELKLVAPSSHKSPEIYSGRIKNMMMTINCLNKFHLDEFLFVVSINSAYNFAQMKLAAAVFGLNFNNWVMETEVLGVKGRFPVEVGSQWDRRLAGLYKAEFLGHKDL